MHPKRLRGNRETLLLHLFPPGCICHAWHRAVSQQQPQTSLTPALNSSVGWKEFKIISLHSGVSYSWVPDSHCFDSPFPNLVPGSEPGAAQFHSASTVWMQGAWSLLSFPGWGWRTSCLIHLSLETLAPPGFLLVFRPFALCFRTAAPRNPSLKASSACHPCSSFPHGLLDLIGKNGVGTSFSKDEAKHSTEITRFSSIGT